ncbi:hypothetical protein FRC03_002695 [Tulasnella sp. 419]|nr:hypothetical protein FRC03_002695 [Tulasnella sp. 419]
MELQKAVGPDGKIVGVDFSENMISKAASNGCQNVFVGDAQALMFPDDMVQQGIHIGYDAVFSNAALHWCKRDPRGVIYSVRRVLKNDGAGRFVAEMGGYMNCIGVRSALHLVLKARGYKPEELDPWYFPSIEEYRTLLEEEGFEIKHISLNPRITNLPGDLKDWLRTFCRTTWLGAMSDEEAEDIISEVEQISSVDSKDSSGRWAIMYVRLRFEAVLPGVV